jgi:hypothetical protein
MHFSMAPRISKNHIVQCLTIESMSTPVPFPSTKKRTTVYVFYSIGVCKNVQRVSVAIKSLDRYMTGGASTGQSFLDRNRRRVNEAPRRLPGRAYLAYGSSDTRASRRRMEPTESNAYGSCGEIVCMPKIWSLECCLWDRL